MKKLSVFLIIVILINSFFISGCSQKKKYSKIFLEYFDTYSTVVGYETDEQIFNKNTEEIELLLKEYHQLFDIYNSYSSINNIYTVNKNAGIEPVKVDTKIIEIIDYAKNINELTKGKTDITLGSVLKIWHNYRESGIGNPNDAKLPEREALIEASKHTGFDKIEIDRENNTVFITDSEMSLDLGAVAKGYVTEKIANYLEQKGVTGYALNFGGNIRVLGNKPDGTDWTADVTNPNTTAENSSIMRVKLKRASFVTSGSYIRYYTVDDIRYHHIIDPETLYPKNDFLSVSVSCEDSGLADSLSTALFNMDIEEGKEVLSRLENVDVLWVTEGEEIIYTDGFEEIIIKE